MIPPGFEKHLNLLDHSLATLWRRRSKNLAVILVFSGVIFLLASFQLLTRALTESASAVLAKTPDITIQRMSAGRQEGIPLDYAEKLLSVFGIRQIAPRIWGYYFDEVHLANYTVMALDTGRMPQGEKLDLSLAWGRFPKPGESGAAVVGRSVQDLLDLKSRRRFSLFRPDLSLKPLEVVGVFDRRTDLLTNDMIVMNQADGRDLFGVAADRATDLCIYVANPAEVGTVARKAAALLPDTRVLTRDHISKTYQVVFGWRSGFASICLLTALAAFVILAWDKASGLSPEERREIGILKVLGWHTTDIIAVRFWESVTVAGLAFVVGWTAAFIHVAHFDAGLFKPVMVGWSVIRPPLRLVPEVNLADLLLTFSCSVLPYLAATVIPSWRSAAVPASSVIR